MVIDLENWSKVTMVMQKIMYKEMNSKVFNSFVSSILRNEIAEHGATLITDVSINNNDKMAQYRFDAIAVKKVEDRQLMVIFRYMYNIKKTPYDKFLSQIFNVQKRLNDKRIIVIPVIISNEEKKDYRGLEFSTKEDPRVEIIYKDTISKWIKKYPIDYLNALNVDQSYIGDFSKNLTLKNFKDKSESNKNVLESIVKNKDNFALVLGAGISVQPGAKAWRDLMNDMFKSVKTKRLLDSRLNVCEKVGTTELISAQLCKDVYNDDKEFYWDLHNGIYADKKPIDKTYSIDAIADLVGRLEQKRNFRVLTYNFDEYLETYLSNKGINYNTLFDCDCEVNQFVSIYHVHGFLPETTAKSNLEKRCLDSIYLTEESYNKLYNHPYSWPISTQLSFFRENICLFVGCGLTDPNIRRLLEIAYNGNKSHYAILKKDSNSKKDLAVITKHFSRIGVEIIWIDDFKEIKTIIDRLGD